MKKNTNKVELQEATPEELKIVVYFFLTAMALILTSITFVTITIGRLLFN